MSERDEIVRAVLDHYGRTHAEELGIDLDRPGPSELFRLLTAALLMSARISADIAVEAAEALFDAGLRTARAMADAAWQKRVDILNGSGYARYDESTAAMLGDTAEHLLERYDGDLRRLRDDAGRDPAAERRLLKECKGVGDVGVDIFFREVQVVWDELFPFADRRALSAADDLDLGRDAEDLAGLVDRRDAARLIVGLVRVDLAGDAQRVRRIASGQERPVRPDASKAELYQRAKEEGIEGRSSMSKDELARALSDDGG